MEASMIIANTDTAERVYVIAEIGGNHNGDPEAALRLVEAAATTGADAVKFQTYRAETLVHPSLEAMPLARPRYKRQVDRFKSLELSPKAYERIVARCAELGIDFMTTPFDLDLLAWVAPHLVAVKIASGDITFHPLIRAGADTGKPVILSTGMATLAEIEAAAELVPAAQRAILHCVSLYPLPDDKAGLNAIPALAERFPDTVIGYSDHTIGAEACIAAVALGARILEKHFTLDTDQELGDHRLSLDPEGMAEMVRQVRRVDTMLGRRQKLPAAGEDAMRRMMRRGIYARRALTTGDTLGPDDLLFMRPETELRPPAAMEITGRRLKRAVAAFEPIRPADLGE
jgi:sialic acid synthase SpsE